MERYKREKIICIEERGKKDEERRKIDEKKN